MFGGKLLYRKDLLGFINGDLIGNDLLVVKFEFGILYNINAMIILFILLFDQSTMGNRFYVDVDGFGGRIPLWYFLFLWWLLLRRVFGLLLRPFIQKDEFVVLSQLVLLVS